MGPDGVHGHHGGDARRDVRGRQRHRGRVRRPARLALVYGRRLGGQHARVRPLARRRAVHAGVARPDQRPRRAPRRLAAPDDPDGARPAARLAGARARHPDAARDRRQVRARARQRAPRVRPRRAPPPRPAPAPPPPARPPPPPAPPPPPLSLFFFFFFFFRPTPLSSAAA